MKKNYLEKLRRWRSSLLMLSIAMCFSLGVNAQTFSNTTCGAAISADGSCNTTNPGASCDIEVTGLAAAVPANLISVKINSITHSWVSDLEVVLVAPTGERLLLMEGIGGSGDDVIDAVFTDVASGPISGAAPFTGTWQPLPSTTGVLCTQTNPTISTFAEIGGGDVVPDGTWTLEVQDNAGGDGGSIDSWEITFPEPCSGAPDGGTIVADFPAFCDNTEVNLSITGATSAIGIEYQWQESADGTTWADIAGETNTTYTATTAGFYRRLTRCGSTPGVDETPSTEIELTAPVPTYATLPYTQDFETWQSVCDDSDAPDASWKNIPATGNRSWRRQDQQATANWTSPTLGAFALDPANGAGAARFHLYEVSSGDDGILDLYLDLSGAAAKRLSFQYINETVSSFNPPSKLEVLLSEDGGATFGAPIFEQELSATWTDYTVDFSSTSATAVLRFRAVSDFGVDDIGLDNVTVEELPVCAGTPTAGTTVTSSGTFCGTGTAELSVTGASDASESGFTFLWEVSTDGGATWAPAAGTNDEATYTATVTENSSFRRQITCTASTESATSAPVAIAEYSPTYFSLTPATPLDERFEAWENGCDDSDVPSNNWFNTPSSGDRSWRRQDQGVSTGGWGNNFSAFTLITENEGFAARLHTRDMPVGTDGTLDFYVDLSGAGPKTLSFFYRNSGGTDRLEVLVSEDGGATFAAPLIELTTNSAWTTHTLEITSTSATSVIRFRGIGDDGFSDIGLDNVSLVELAPCAGLPEGGTLSASVTDACLGTPELTVAGASDETSFGFSYQWQASTDAGATWADVAGATDADFTANPSVTTSYRRQITCDATGDAAFSTEVEIVVSFAPTPFVFSAATPFLEDFEAWEDGCDDSDVPSSNWKGTPSTGNASWRRQDQGATAGWSFLPTGLVSPTSGTGAANFHSYGASPSGIQGSLDLYLDMSGATGSIALKFLYQNASGTDNLQVQLSTDGGATFTTLGTLTTAAWEEQLFVFSSTSANTILRFLATSDFGANDIGIDNVSLEEVLPCTGTPEAGIAVATPNNACASPTAVITIVGDENTDLREFQWQSSLDDATWVDMAGETGEELNISGVSVTTWYRRVTTCAASGESAASTSVSYEVSAAIVAATLPYTQNFEATWEDGCGVQDLPDEAWFNTPNTGDNSWRRQDAGATAGWSFLPGGLVVPVSGSGAANFHSFGAGGGDQGSLDFYFDASAPEAKRLTFLYANPPAEAPFFGNTDVLEVLESNDGGVTFTSLGTLTETPFASPWVLQTFDLTVTSSNSVIRLLATSDFGDTDIGVDDFSVILITPCAGTPEAGVTTASLTTLCPPSISQTDLTVSGSSADTQSGLTYQWQESVDGVTYTDITGATDITYTASPGSSTYYQLVMTCTASGLIDISAPIQIIVPVINVATLPFEEGFNPTWVDRCDVRDIPNSFWTNTPITGDNSWRRNGDGESAGWAFLGDVALFTPSLFEGAGFAQFHSYGAGGGEQGDLDVYVDASPAGDKRLVFQYNNSPAAAPFFGNTDDLEVLLSTDGGTSFTSIGNFGETDGWEENIIDFTSLSANTVIRFRATSDFGDTDIGVDLVQIGIISACAGTPVAGTAVADPENLCNQPTSTITVTGANDTFTTGFSYQWQESTDGGATWADIAGATDAEYVASPTVTTLYRRVMTCIATGDNAPSAAAEVEVIAPVYAAIPYLATFESSWSNGCATDDLPDVHWKNTPATGNNSWRRQDEGVSADWELLGNFGVVPEINVQPISGTGAATFHSHGTFSGGGVGETGTLDLYIDASPAGTKALSFLYSNKVVDLTAFGFPTINDDVVNVYESTDGGATFTLLDTFGEANNWEEQFIILTSNSATTVIRFEGVRDGGNSNIGVDNVEVRVIPPCEDLASLNGGTANASPNDFCISLTNEITVSGSSATDAVGFTYQWQESTDGGVTWADIADETGLTLTVTPNVTTSYRRNIICTAGGTSAFSEPVEILAPPIQFATMPFEETFNNTWVDACDTRDVPFGNADGDLFWKNTPATGNTSWRRVGDGASAGWAFLGDADVFEQPLFEGTGYAAFHSYGAGGGTSGTLDLYVNASSPNVRQLSFYYNNSPADAPFFGNTDDLEVLESADGGATFTTLVTLGETDGWEEQVINLTSDSPTTIIRFRGISDFGDTDIGVDLVKVIAPFPNDVGVSAIELDVCSPAFANVIVEITNFGSEVASDFPVTYTVDGTTVTEQFTGSIEPFATASYAFSIPVSVLGITSVDITAATAWTLDQNNANDSFNEVIDLGTGQTLPYFTDFNTGLPGGWLTETTDAGWFLGTPNNNGTLTGTFPNNPGLYDFDIDAGPAYDGDNSFMAVDDDADGAGETGIDYLIMPTFDLSNYTDVSLSFDVFFSNAFGGIFTVEVSTDGGATYGAPVYTLNAGLPWTTVNVDMADYEGESSVSIRFVHDDEGGWNEGVAIDNVGIDGTLLANPSVTVSTPEVADAFVLQGTQNHILYQMDLTVVDANTTFSDLVFTTAGTYDDDDLVANSFTLWYSTDDVLGVGDTQLGSYTTVASGEQLIFNCLSQPINAGTVGYLFLTVDIDAAGTIGNTVFVTAPDIATGVIFLSGDVAGSTLAGGVQTIALPNNAPTSEDNRVETVKNVAYTFTATDFVFADVDATDVLTQVSIASVNLPAGATLTLGGAAVTQGTVIDATQIGSLVFTPAADGIGDNYASFTFRVSDGRDFSDLQYNMIVDVVSDEIFVPSLFSPNNDGANETFVVLGANGNIGSMTLKIFDRNNNLVFETSDIAEATQIGWDGTKDGKEQPAGAYIWLIEGTYSNGDPLEFEGKITGVIRMIR